MVMHKRSVKELERACLSIRKDILDLATREVMHVGGDLSITDVMTPKIPMNYTQVCNKVSANKQYIIDILNKKQTIQSIHTS